MKTWAEVDASPEFHLASDDVKQEIRAFYRDGIASSPGFASLSPQDKAAVLRAVEGDEDYPIRMAAALIVAAQRGTLARAMVDADVNAEPGLKMVLKGAKYAERFLDVPVEERPRDAFSDSIPKHLDRPLRALLGFVDDALPEYSQDKFWRTHAKATLLEKIRNVLALSNEFSPNPLDARGVLLSFSPITTYSMLDSRIPTRLPPVSQWAPQDADRALRKDPEALLKFGLPQVQWARIDAAVSSTVVSTVLAPIKQGVPRGVRPDAVTRVASDVRKDAYEYLARALYQIPAAGSPLPVDAEHLASVILAADVLGNGMSAIAASYPYLFSVVSGIAAVPDAAKNRFFAFIEELGVPLTPQFLLSAVTTGRTSLIRLATVDEMLFQEGAAQAGAPSDSMPLLQRDAATVRTQPLLAALVAFTEVLDRQAYKDAQKKVRAKVQEEVRRQFAAPAPAALKNQDNGGEEAPEVASKAAPEATSETLSNDEEGASEPVVEGVDSPESLGYEEPVDEPVEGPTGAPAGEPVEKPVKEAAEEPVEAPATAPVVIVVPAPEVTIVNSPAPETSLSKFGDVLSVDPQTIQERSDYGRDPRSVKRREKRAAGVRQRFAGKNLPLAVVMQKKDGSMVYLDGSHRGALAQEHGDRLNVAVVPEDDCHRMMDQEGLDEKEIALKALQAAGAAGVESAAHLMAQYPNLKREDSGKTV